MNSDFLWMGVALNSSIIWREVSRQFDRGNVCRLKPTSLWFVLNFELNMKNSPALLTTSHLVTRVLLPYDALKTRNRCNSWHDENCSASCMLQNSVSLLISLVSQQIHLLHISIIICVVPVWGRNISAGRSNNRLCWHRFTPRTLCECYLHILCASLTWSTSGEFSSQSTKCMQIKLWHKQALDAEYRSSKKQPSSLDNQRTSAVKNNPRHPKAPKCLWSFLIWFMNLTQNPFASVETI